MAKPHRHRGSRPFARSRVRVATAACQAWTVVGPPWSQWPVNGGGFKMQASVSTRKRAALLHLVSVMRFGDPSAGEWKRQGQ